MTRGGGVFPSLNSDAEIDMISTVSSEVFDPIQEVIQLHRQVDKVVEEHTGSYPTKLQCGPQCNSCCVDGLTIFEIEALVLKTYYPSVLNKGKVGPPGQCAMLDGNGLCQVYEHRPYVCRTQGLPLRWIEGEVENRSICELNEEALDLVQLPSSSCFELGPNEAALAMTQARYQGLGPGSTELRRVALRELFVAEQDDQ